MEAARDVAVLSHAFWTNRYGRDPHVLGRTVLLSGSPYTIVGVMAADFRFPRPDVALWLPFAFTAQDLEYRGNHSFTVVGRLRPGLTLASAERELDDLVARFIADPGVEFHGWHPVHLRSLREEIVGDVSRTLWVMLAAVALVLMIACANVANLLLVRSEERAREITDARSTCRCAASRSRPIGSLWPSVSSLVSQTRPVDCAKRSGSLSPSSRFPWSARWRIWPAHRRPDPVSIHGCSGSSRRSR
jgi:hypothetical protein